VFHFQSLGVRFSTGSTPVRHRHAPDIHEKCGTATEPGHAMIYTMPKLTPSLPRRLARKLGPTSSRQLGRKTLRTPPDAVKTHSSERPPSTIRNRVRRSRWRSSDPREPPRRKRRIAKRRRAFPPDEPTHEVVRRYLRMTCDLPMIVLVSGVPRSLRSSEWCKRNAEHATLKEANQRPRC
jgi:hypothetical protein